MARFPEKEAEISALAERMVAGFNDNIAVFPLPPVLPPALNMKNMVFRITRCHANGANAAAEQATAARDEALEALTEALKSNIRYAENTVNFDDDKLKLIGWSGRKTATALAPPGQVRQLEAPKQGEGQLFLDWKAPADGGAASAYRVQRRHRPNGLWQDVATAIETEITLVNQPKGSELEYRVIAINKAGEGEASNTVMAVL